MPHAERRIRAALLAWYRRTARALPWRETKDVYHVWVSEILLQQTRVATVVPYYERFLAAFPSVQALATAPLERVLKVWQGLGYYTRARHLHRAARLIVMQRAGQFPSTAAEWQHLPGIGRYTASAIASITRGERVAAVDGNVKRVLARLFHIRSDIDRPATQAELWRLANELVPRAAPGDFNQALMELGARVCTLRQPHCDACPMRAGCAGVAAGVAERLPRRGARRPARPVNLAAAAIRRRERVLLVRRPATGLLAGLWTLPSVELANGVAPDEALRTGLARAFGRAVIVGAELGMVRHELSHRRMRVVVFACTFEEGRPALRRRVGLRWVSATAAGAGPLGTLDRKLLALVIGRAEEDAAGQRLPQEQ